MDDFEKLINASDLIEWIMETYPDWCVGAVRSIVDHVEDLSPAQQEIIRCKECKYYDGRPCGIVDWYNTADDFCSRAEKREE